MKRILRSVRPLVVGYLIGSCGGSDGITGLPHRPTTATVTISLDTASLGPTATIQLSAAAMDVSGKSLERDFAWSTSDSAIATVSPNGLVTGVLPGSATIAATSEGKSAASSITVLAATAGTATETFTGSAAALSGPWTQQRSAGTVNKNGAGAGIGSVNAKDLHAFWNAATFNNDQYSQLRIAGGLTSYTQYAIVLVRASGAGDAADNNYAFATDGSSGAGHTDLSKNINGTQTILRNFATTFVAGDVMKIDVVGTLITCYKNGVSIGTYTDASLASGSPGVGMYGSTVTIDDWEGNSLGVVSPPAPVATVTVSPATATAVVGSTQQLTATLKDASNNTLTGRAVSWMSDNTAVATVNSTGLVNAVSAGSATITATSEGVSGTSSITVSAATAGTATETFTGSAAVLSGPWTQQRSAGTVNKNGLGVGVGSVGAKNLYAFWNAGTFSNDQYSQIRIAGGLGRGTQYARVTVRAGGTGDAAYGGYIFISDGTSGAGHTELWKVVAGTQTLLRTFATTFATNDVMRIEVRGQTITCLKNGISLGSFPDGSLATGSPGVGVYGTTVRIDDWEGSSLDPVSPPAPVATVTVSPATATAVVGSTQQLTATTKDAGGTTLAGRTVTWVTDNTAVATVNSTGLVSAVSAGSATITATSEGKSAASSITVLAATAGTATETFTGSAAALSGPWTQQRSAGTVNKNGAGAGIGSVNAKDLHAFWNAATFNNDQYSQLRIAGGLTSYTQYAIVLVRASGAGDAADNNYAFATDGSSGAGHTDLSKNINGTQTILRNFATTFAAGDVMKIDIVGTLITCYKNGVALGTYTDASLASGSPGIGMYGSTVTIDDWEGNSLGAVSPPAPVATVTVSPPTATAVVGSTQQLTATLKDASNNTLTGRAVSWMSDNTAVATVNSTGLVNAVSAGSATITATSETKTGTSSITVTFVPVATVTVNPPSTSLVVGGRQQLTATLRDAANNVLTGRSVTWSSGNTVAATVDGNGLLAAVGTGVATITATSETKTGTSQITVTASTGGSGIAGPLRVSTVNRRYFADPSGRVVYLTGSGYWNTIEDNGPSNPPPVFDYSAFLDFLQRHNHNFTRLFMWEQARWSSLSTIDHWFSPNLYVRTGPGIGLDAAPKFDLTQINPAYLARVRQRVIDAGARGIYVSVMLFNGWSVEFKSGTGNNPWLSHPFNASNNINSINGDPNNDQSGQEIQTLSIPVVTALQDTYVRAVIDAVNDLDNVIYEISNETNSNPAADAWQYHMINLIRSYEAGKPKQHPIGMSVPWPSGSNSEVLNSTADWVAMNGDANGPPAADGSKVSLWDTDHLCGICGDAAWPWRSLMRGHNPLLMDGYNGAPGYTDPAYNPSDPKWEVIRTNMGYARSYALRMDLAHAVPRSDLSNTSFCLAVVGSEYLVFNAESGSVSVNLAGVSGSRTVEWFNPATGQAMAGGTVTGGGSVSLTPPFSGMSVVYIHP